MQFHPTLCKANPIDGTSWAKFELLFQYFWECYVHFSNFSSNFGQTLTFLKHQKNYGWSKIVRKAKETFRQSKNHRISQFKSALKMRKKRDKEDCQMMQGCLTTIRATGKGLRQALSNIWQHSPKRIKIKNRNLLLIL